jgi:hypothetical protein
MERGMVNVNLVYGTHVTDNDPRLHPVLIVGQLKNLNRIKFDDIKCKLGGRVSEEVLSLLNPQVTLVLSCNHMISQSCFFEVCIGLFQNWD